MIGFLFCFMSFLRHILTDFMLVFSLSLSRSLSLSDVLALPIFKQEDSSIPPENETKNPPFQYVLCAATSPAVKLHDETLTYLNQGETQYMHSKVLVESPHVVVVSLYIFQLEQLKRHIRTLIRDGSHTHVPLFVL